MARYSGRVEIRRAAEISRSVARRALSPEFYDSTGFRLRRVRKLVSRDDPATSLDRRLFAEFGPVIRHGPFQGVIYDRRVIRHTTAVAAKLVGAYEIEIHPFIERIVSSPMSRFIDVGCAEGYYVVGIGRRRPDAEIIAFDIDAAARQMCRMTAKANNVNADIRRLATTDYLATLAPGTVILSDCEGAERELLDPVQAPALCEVTILVEVHDFLSPGLTAELVNRFARSHKVDIIRTASRNHFRCVELAGLGKAERDLALSEGRPAEMGWMFLKPRGAGS
jgi:hypothetical protein